MKTTSLRHIALLAVVLCSGSLTTAFAQATTPITPPPSTGGTAAANAKALTPAEQAQLKAARDKVFATNPELKTQGEALRAAHKAAKKNGTPMSADSVAQAKAFKDQLRAAMLKVDPTLGPIFAKQDAARAAHWGAVGANQ